MVKVREKLKKNEVKTSGKIVQENWFKGYKF